MGVILPAEYQEVEYLESTGTQYIKTNYRPSRYDEVDCEFWLDTIPISAWMYHALFSAGNKDPQFIFLIANTPNNMSRPVNGAYYKYFASNIATNFYFYPVAKEVYSLHIDQNGLASCNGYTAQSNYVGDVNTDLYIFIRANNESAFDGRIYKFQITNSGETKLNLIPCYRKSDSKTGMYDLVSGTFFTNAGTGEFTVGPDVIDSISPLMVAWRRALMGLVHGKKYFRSWTKGLWTATGRITTSLNGSVSSIEEYSQDVVVSVQPGAESVIVFFDADNNYIGKVNDAGEIDKIAGRWYWWTGDLRISQFATDDTRYFRISMRPTDGFNVTSDNIIEWSNTHAIMKK